jgi:hypothetical protein
MWWCKLGGCVNESMDLVNRNCLKELVFGKCMKAFSSSCILLSSFER